jgi:hypothetical protein
MSQSLEDLLDATLDVRRQHEAERVDRQKAIGDAELERCQTQYCTEVHSLIQQAVERANRDLAKRPGCWNIHEISGSNTGPLYVSGSTCHPIA